MDCGRGLTQSERRVTRSLCWKLSQHLPGNQIVPQAKGVEMLKRVKIRDG